MVTILNVLERKDTPSGVQQVSRNMQAGTYQVQAWHHWRMQPVPMPRSKHSIRNSPSRLIPAVFCFSKKTHSSNPWMPMFYNSRKEVMPLAFKNQILLYTIVKSQSKNSTI
jgi:hypothetical protein